MEDSALHKVFNVDEYLNKYHNKNRNKNRNEDHNEDHNEESNKDFDVSRYRAEIYEFFISNKGKTDFNGHPKQYSETKIIQSVREKAKDQKWVQSSINRQLKRMVDEDFEYKKISYRIIRNGGLYSIVETTSVKDEDMNALIRCLHIDKTSVSYYGSKPNAFYFKVKRNKFDFNKTFQLIRRVFGESLWDDTYQEDENFEYVQIRLCPLVKDTPSLSESFLAKIGDACRYWTE